MRSLQHSDECWKSWSLSCYRKNCCLRSCWSCYRRRNHRRSCHPADSAVLSAVLPALPWLLPRPLPADGLPPLPLLQPLPAGGLLLLLPLLRWLPGLPHRLLPGLPQTSSGLPDSVRLQLPAMHRLLPALSAVLPAPGCLHLPGKLLLSELPHQPLPELLLPPEPRLPPGLPSQLRYAPPLPELPVPIQMQRRYPVLHMRSDLSDPESRNHIPARWPASWLLPVLRWPDLLRKLLPASGLLCQELPGLLLFSPLPALRTLLPRTRYRSLHTLWKHNLPHHHPLQPLPSRRRPRGLSASRNRLPWKSPRNCCLRRNEPSESRSRLLP